MSDENNDKSSETNSGTLLRSDNLVGGAPQIRHAAPPPGLGGGDLESQRQILSARRQHLQNELAKEDARLKQIGQQQQQLQPHEFNVNLAGPGLDAAAFSAGLLGAVPLLDPMSNPLLMPMAPPHPAAQHFHHQQQQQQHFQPRHHQPVPQPHFHNHQNQRPYPRHQQQQQQQQFRPQHHQQQQQRRPYRRRMQAPVGGGPFEALHVHPLYKSRLCRHFVAGGYCAWGDLCRFAHGSQDLRLPGEAVEEYAARTGRNLVDLFKSLALDAPRIERTDDGSVRAVARVNSTVEAVIPGAHAPPDQIRPASSQRRGRGPLRAGRVTEEAVRAAAQAAAQLATQLEQQNLADELERQQQHQLRTVAGRQVPAEAKTVTSPPTTTTAMAAPTSENATAEGEDPAAGELSQGIQHLQLNAPVSASSSLFSAAPANLELSPQDDPVVAN